MNPQLNFVLIGKCAHVNVLTKMRNIRIKHTKLHVIVSFVNQKKLHEVWILEKLHLGNFSLYTQYQHIYDYLYPYYR